MTVREVVDLAQNSELKNIAVGRENATVIGYINLGLIELYKRFPIETDEVVIRLGDPSDPCYISDTTYKMPNNYMGIIAAYDEQPDDSVSMIGNQIPINEEENPESIMTMGFNKIQVPAAPYGAYISIIYSAGPSLIISSSLLDSSGNFINDADIPLPYFMMEPLLHYIGYRGYLSLNADVNTDNNTHYMRFDASCRRILELGLLTGDDVDASIRFIDKGFV